MKRFGVSTHLYLKTDSSGKHLLEVAARHFDAVEVFATRSHFDYHDSAAIASLKEWLADANLELHSVHGPITDVFANGRSSAPSRSRHVMPRRAPLRSVKCPPH